MQENFFKCREAMASLFSNIYHKITYEMDDFGSLHQEDILFAKKCFFGWKEKQKDWFPHTLVYFISIFLVFFVEKPNFYSALLFFTAITFFYIAFEYFFLTKKAYIKSFLGDLSHISNEKKYFFQDMLMFVLWDKIERFNFWILIPYLVGLVGVYIIYYLNFIWGMAVVLLSVISIIFIDKTKTFSSFDYEKKVKKIEEIEGFDDEDFYIEQ